MWYRYKITCNSSFMNYPPPFLTSEKLSLEKDHSFRIPPAQFLAWYQGYFIPYCRQENETEAKELVCFGEKEFSGSTVKREKKS